MKTLATGLMLLLATTVAADAADELKAFPPPEPGMVRYVLQLQEQPDESTYQVELIVGKTVSLDPQNQYFFGGQIEAETIQGWGYTRYVVPTLGPMAGTLMAVDPDAPKVERFITLRGGPYLIRYNSRLPIVVYVPQGVDVRYRMWASGPEAAPMAQG
jgi:ecotin